MLQEAQKQHKKAITKTYKQLRNLLSGDLQSHWDLFCREMHEGDLWAGVNGQVTIGRYPRTWAAFRDCLELHKLTVFSADTAKRQWFYIQQAVRKFQRATVRQHISQVECTSICKSADCLSAHLLIFWFLGQQICHSQIFHFLSFSVPALHVCLFICLFFFLVVCLFFHPFFWQDLDEAQYPTTPTSILQRTTTAHSYPLLLSPHHHTHATMNAGQPKDNNAGNSIILGEDRGFRFLWGGPT